jgi:preprotein translocase subunit YajC
MTLLDLLPFAAIAAAFWLLIIRPASTRRKAQAALVASLAPGQRIMTTAGVFGTLVARDGDRVAVEVAPGVVIEMLAVAIAQVVPAEHAVEDPAEPAALDRADADPDGPPVSSDDAPTPPADDYPAPPALTQESDRG